MKDLTPIYPGTLPAKLVQAPYSQKTLNELEPINPYFLAEKFEKLHLSVSETEKCIKAMCDIEESQ